MPALIQWLCAWYKLANACLRCLAGRAHAGHNMSMVKDEICKAALEVVVMLLWTLSSSILPHPEVPSPSPAPHCLSPFVFCRLASEHSSSSKQCCGLLHRARLYSVGLVRSSAEPHWCVGNGSRSCESCTLSCLYTLLLLPKYKCKISKNSHLTHLNLVFTSNGKFLLFLIISERAGFDRCFFSF